MPHIIVTYLFIYIFLPFLLCLFNFFFFGIVLGTERERGREKRAVENASCRNLAGIYQRWARCLAPGRGPALPSPRGAERGRAGHLAAGLLLSVTRNGSGAGLGGGNHPLEKQGKEGGK